MTTNPSLVAKTGRDLFEVLGRGVRRGRGPVSAEVTATEDGDMVGEGRRLADIADNITVRYR